MRLKPWVIVDFGCSLAATDEATEGPWNSVGLLVSRSCYLVAAVVTVGLVHEAKGEEEVHHYDAEQA